MSSKKEHILDAAVILFSERGYDGTTVPMIADKAQVGAGTIYRYFENKEYLVNYLYQYYFNMLIEEVQPTFITGNRSFREKFRRTFVKIVEFANRDFHGFKFINQSCNAIYLTEKSKELFTDFLHALHVSLEEGKQAGIIRPLPSEVLIAIVYGAIIELCNLTSMGILQEENLDVLAVEDCCWSAIKV